MNDRMEDQLNKVREAREKYVARVGSMKDLTSRDGIHSLRRVLAEIEEMFSVIVREIELTDNSVEATGRDLESHVDAYHR